MDSQLIILKKLLRGLIVCVYFVASFIFITYKNPVYATGINAEDINKDGKVDIFDYNNLVAEFNARYTIYEYNSFVSYFRETTNQRYVTRNIVKLDNTKSLSITNSLGARTELPIAVFGTGARQLTLSTGFTYACWTHQNPLLEVVTLTSVNCLKTVDGGVFSDPEHYEQFKPWRRNYYGTFSAHIVLQGLEQRVVYINHGENKK